MVRCDHGHQRYLLCVRNAAPHTDSHLAFARSYLAVSAVIKENLWELIAFLVAALMLMVRVVLDYVWRDTLCKEDAELSFCEAVLVLAILWQVAYFVVGYFVATEMGWCAVVAICATRRDLQEVLQRSRHGSQSEAHVEHLPGLPEHAQARLADDRVADLHRSVLLIRGLLNAAARLCSQNACLVGFLPAWCHRQLLHDHH